MSDKTWFSVILLILMVASSCSTKLEPTTVLADKDLTIDKARLYLNLSRSQLNDLISTLKNQKELTSAVGKKELKTIAERNALKQAWSRFLDNIALAQQIEEAFSDYSNIKDKKNRHIVFLVHYEAFLLSYRSSLSILEELESSPAVDIILNENVDWLGIPADSYSALKQYFLNLEIATRFAAYQAVQAYYSSQTDLDLNASVKEDQDFIWSMSKGPGVAMTFENGLQILRDWSKSLLFPAQKSVSQLMGDIKVKRVKQYLITDQQIHQLQDQFRPGDILMERREWYLSNIGLPGFWPHMALYIGTAEERAAFFAGNQEVVTWVQNHGIDSGDFEELLEVTYPIAYKKSSKQQEDGFNPRVIEAIGKGVSFTTLEYSAGADSLGVLRPKLDKVELARAIYTAFSYYGKPYDFDFDLLTDNEVICSELIFKAFEPEPPFQGIDIPVITMLGRKVSPPNKTVQLFDETYGTDRQQMEFVLFLDGYEKEKKAYVSNLTAFRNSWKRPKWHIFFQKKGK